MKVRFLVSSPHSANDRWAEQMTEALRHEGIDAETRDTRYEFVSQMYESVLVCVTHRLSRPTEFMRAHQRGNVVVLVDCCGNIGHDVPCLTWYDGVVCQTTKELNVVAPQTFIPRHWDIRVEGRHDVSHGKVFRIGYFGSHDEALWLNKLRRDLGEEFVDFSDRNFTEQLFGMEQVSFHYSCQDPATPTVGQKIVNAFGCGCHVVCPKGWYPLPETSEHRSYPFLAKSHQYDDILAAIDRAREAFNERNEPDIDELRERTRLRTLVPNGLRSFRRSPRTAVREW